MNQDKKTEIRWGTVATLLYSWRGQHHQAQEAATRVLALCRQEDYPRFRALTLIHWARALHGAWNRDTVHEERFEEGLREHLAPALRLLIPQAEAQKGLEATPWEEWLEVWKKPYAEGFKETVTELIEVLQPDEAAQLHREIGRLWREWAWAGRRMGYLKSKDPSPEAKWERFFRIPITRVSADHLWWAATGDNTIPQSKWWQDKPQDIQQKVAQQIENVAHFWPLAALIDLGWHYHYQQVLTLGEEETLCHWIEEQFPTDYRVRGLEDWPPKAAINDAVDPDDPRLFGQLGKLWMLKGHGYLRHIRLAPKEQKRDLVRQAVQQIALALEYDYLLGKGSLGIGRGEANLHDWLLRHGFELVDVEHTILDTFLEEVKILREKCPGESRCRLYKFLHERFS